MSVSACVLAAGDSSGEPAWIIPLDCPHLTQLTKGEDLSSSSLFGLYPELQAWRVTFNVPLLMPMLF